MNDSTAAVIQQLADKLGTTSEYLWSVLIKQAPIYAAISVTEIAVTAVLVILFVKSLPWAKRLMDSSDSDKDFLGSVYVIAGCAALAVLAAVEFFAIGRIVTATLNPEYWAFKEVLSAIKVK